jgi:hypothetical protein
MSSPIEAPSAPPSDAEPKKGEGAFDFLGKIPHPKWAVFCVGVVTVLGSLVPFYTKVVEPWIKQPQTRTAETDTLQFKEYQKHFGEQPRNKQPVFESADLGSLIVQFYSSDGCLLVLRKNPGPNQLEIGHWIPASSISEHPPGRIETRSSITQHFQEDVPFLTAQIRPLALIGAASAPVSGNCVNPHPGPFRSWNGEQRTCWLAVWRAWPDGCQHYQWFNTCNGYWDIEPNGAPRVYWTSCTH